MRILHEISPNKAATVLRAALAAKRITQTRAARDNNLDASNLNGFLTRRLNLLDSEIIQLFRYLGLEKIETTLSAPAIFEKEVSDVG